MAIEYHQCNKSYTVPNFTYNTVLAEQTQDMDEDAAEPPSQDNENLIEKMQFQDKRYEVKVYESRYIAHLATSGYNWEATINEHAH